MPRMTKWEADVAPIRSIKLVEEADINFAHASKETIEPGSALHRGTPRISAFSFDRHPSAIALGVEVRAISARNVAPIALNGAAIVERHACHASFSSGLFVPSGESAHA